MTDSTARRRQVADAAIATLAREGMRGLTHRAVDRAADLPQGSCSYYFRTRQALLQAAVERLVEVDTADLAGHPALLGHGGGPAELAAAAADLVRYWTTSAGDRMRARYELMLEAGRRPELRTALDRARAHYHRLAEQALAAAGATEPAGQAQVFIAFLDGLVFRHLTGADPQSGPPAALDDALHGLLRGFAARRPG
ncbi:TetR family transcriptional regulator [Streptomyces sp. RS10V-4]|uniref:TetR/AcrR family transcriptional regulator n=1 Tax=Streptomyces rhizoryzae TaxID=2932493 RepID=UPI002002DBB4|nr:TetR/AcrR family transcriptional regulator [Streptomyces rhizoryzae]MCK7624949.1 TetR family transcriptional regulator [Streptomyces rhizoryzae]